jgi:HSP20 family protein
LTVIRDPLLAELSNLSDEMDKAFGRVFAQGQNRTRGWLPPADVYETESEVAIELDVPGCRMENLSVEAVDGQLVIAGEREPRHGVARRYRVERWAGRFVRSFSLPQNVRTDSIKADYREGVLTVTLPKPEESKPKRIAISGAEQPAIEQAS